MLVVIGLAFASPITAAPVEAAAAPRLVIPRIHLDLTVAPTLANGPQIYYRDQDTIAIAGHRTTHTHPFLDLPQLRPGDHIQLGHTRYLVKHHAIVKPTEVWVLRYHGLILSACHPAGSSRYRYIIFAARIP